MKHCLNIGLTVLFATSVVTFAIAQGDNEISIVRPVGTFGQKPVPVSLEGFSGEALDALKFDLYVQGFSIVPAAEAQYNITSSGGGAVAGRVTDRYAKKELLARSYSGAGRAAAHAFAEDIVEAITGKPGISQVHGATAKIAFKVQPMGYGPGEIYVSDFDGHNPQQATSDKAIVAAPTWVPGKTALCYNSYALEHNPYIFYHDLDTGKRKVIARYGGSSISPSVSPDGTKVAMVLSKGGLPNIYVANIDGTGVHQLTTGDEDSSPCWSPDGMYIYFATKINERRTLARVSIAGGNIQRISTTGAPNPSEPDISPDGKWIAFTSQSGSYFNICVMPVDGGDPVVVASGEDPSWAPNSRTLVFAKRSAGERYTLSVLDVFTKQAKDIARISGSDSEPAWGK